MLNAIAYLKSVHDREFKLINESYTNKNEFGSLDDTIETFLIDLDISLYGRLFSNVKTIMFRNRADAKLQQKQNNRIVVAVLSQPLDLSLSLSPSCYMIVFVFVLK